MRGVQPMTADAYWIDYFERVCKDGPAWIDYSNERVQLQTVGAVLEVADSLIGRRVLDIGCGRGALCRIAQILGATHITGVDLASEALTALVAQFAGIHWRPGDFTAPEFRATLGAFDTIFSLESMQYLPVPECLDWVFDMLAPGGRFVAMIPYQHCPIVARTAARFEGKYVPPSLDAIVAWGNSNPDATVACRGLRFGSDQSIAPYASSPWITNPDVTPTWPAPPNRIQLVVQRAGPRP